MRGGARSATGVAVVCAAAMVASAIAQQPSTVAIVGGTVHPVSGPPIEAATVLMPSG